MPDSAFYQAELRKTQVLLIFTGSDWCPHCRYLEKTILSDSVFHAFVEKNLVLLIADFPQRKKTDAMRQRENEVLAEKYNPDGTFPYLVLIEPKNRTCSNIPFTRQSKEEMIIQISEGMAAFSVP